MQPPKRVKFVHVAWGYKFVIHFAVLDPRSRFHRFDIGAERGRIIWLGFTYFAEESLGPLETDQGFVGMSQIHRAKPALDVGNLCIGGGEFGSQCRIVAGFVRKTLQILQGDLDDSFASKCRAWQSSNVFFDRE
jgi:hypothetical protein